MITFDGKKLLITKKYAAKAAMYRRVARGAGFIGDESLLALQAMYEHESKGVGSLASLKKGNSFAYGKWMFDITVSSMRDDIESGALFKIDVAKTAIDRLHLMVPLHAKEAYEFHKAFLKEKLKEKEVWDAQIEFNRKNPPAPEKKRPIPNGKFLSPSERKALSVAKEIESKGGDPYGDNE